MSEDVIGRLKCYLFGHDWKHQPDAIPEDRETFRCSRCDKSGFNPSRVTETHVPERYIDAASERGDRDD